MGGGDRQTFILVQCEPWFAVPNGDDAAAVGHGVLIGNRRIAVKVHRVDQSEVPQQHVQYLEERRGKGGEREGRREGREGREKGGEREGRGERKEGRGKGGEGEGRGGSE